MKRRMEGMRFLPGALKDVFCFYSQRLPLTYILALITSMSCGNVWVAPCDIGVI